MSFPSSGKWSFKGFLAKPGLKREKGDFFPFLLPHGKRRFDGVIGAAKIPVFGGIPGEE